MFLAPLTLHLMRAQYVGFEDDIIINLCMAELEKEEEPDPRRMQVNLCVTILASCYQLLMQHKISGEPHRLSRAQHG